MPKPSNVPLRVAPEPTSSASPEVEPPKKSRRVFSPSDKLRILKEADACRGKAGEVAALCRREGIYTSHLSAWRQQLGLRGREGMLAQKRGRKLTRDAKDARIAELEKKTAKLEKELALSKKLIALQKKVAELLGNELPSGEEP